jgi:hypothetical protein
MIDRITEFQSFDFHQDGAYRIMLALAIAFAGACASLAVRRPERFLLSILLMAVALHSVRALPVAALLLLPLAAGSMTTVLARARGLAPWLRRKLDDALNYGDRLQAIDQCFCGYATIPLAALLIFALAGSEARFPPGISPVAASAAVAALPGSARILATDSFGGYLIYRFSGERKVFFDGRSDFYGKQFMDGYLRLVEARPGWRAEFNGWNFTHALLPPDCALVAALVDYGWQEIYRDGTAVLLTGRSAL